MDNKVKKEEQQQPEQTPREQPQRSSAFNEQSTKDQKSTRNIEEDAGREQQAIDQEGPGAIDKGQ